MSSPVDNTNTNLNIGAMPAPASNPIGVINNVVTNSTLPESIARHTAASVLPGAIIPVQPILRNAPRFGILNPSARGLTPGSLAPLSLDAYSNFIRGHYAVDGVQGLVAHVRDVAAFCHNFTYGSDFANRLFPTPNSNPSLITKQTLEDFENSKPLRRAHRMLADVALATFAIKRIKSRVILTQPPAWLSADAAPKRALLLQVVHNLRLFGSIKLAKNLCNLIINVLVKKGLTEEVKAFEYVRDGKLELLAPHFWALLNRPAKPPTSSPQTGQPYVFERLKKTKPVVKPSDSERTNTEQEQTTEAEKMAEAARLNKLTSKHRQELHEQKTKIATIKEKIATLVSTLNIRRREQLRLSLTESLQKLFAELSVITANFTTQLNNTQHQEEKRIFQHTVSQFTDLQKQINDILKLLEKYSRSLESYQSLVLLMRNKITSALANTNSIHQEQELLQFREELRVLHDDISQIITERENQPALITELNAIQNQITMLFDQCQLPAQMPSDITDFVYHQEQPQATAEQTQVTGLAVGEMEELAEGGTDRSLTAQETLENVDLTLSIIAQTLEPSSIITHKLNDELEQLLTDFSILLAEAPSQQRTQRWQQLNSKLTQLYHRTAQHTKNLAEYVYAIDLKLAKLVLRDEHKLALLNCREQLLNVYEPALQLNNSTRAAFPKLPPEALHRYLEQHAEHYAKIQTSLSQKLTQLEIKLLALASSNLDDEAKRLQRELLQVESILLNREAKRVLDKILYLTPKIYFSEYYQPMMQTKTLILSIIEQVHRLFPESPLAAFEASLRLAEAEVTLPQADRTLPEQEARLSEAQIQALAAQPAASATYAEDWLATEQRLRFDGSHLPSFNQLETVFPDNQPTKAKGKKRIKFDTTVEVKLIPTLDGERINRQRLQRERFSQFSNMLTQELSRLTLHGQRQNIPEQQEPSNMTESSFQVAPREDNLESDTVISLVNNDVADLNDFEDQ